MPQARHDDPPSWMESDPGSPQSIGCVGARGVVAHRYRQIASHGIPSPSPSMRGFLHVRSWKRASAHPLIWAHDLITEQLNPPCEATGGTGRLDTVCVTEVPRLSWRHSQGAFRSALDSDHRPRLNSFATASRLSRVRSFRYARYAQAAPVLTSSAFTSMSATFTCATVRP